MTTKLPASFLPAKFQVLSGSALKLIAITLMLIDHTGLMILYNYPATTATLFSFGGVDYSWYRIFRDIGRAAFPIFCFLLVEGFLHTHNRKKYGLNLFLFACISEIPWNFMFTNTWRYEKQNVFFTLFLGYLAFCALEYFWDNQKMQLVCVLALLTVSVFLKADYGWRGFVFLLIMYWFRNDKTAQAIIGSCWLYYLVTGVVVAFFVSVIAIKFLMGYIKKHDFKAFGWYRIVLGILVLGYFIGRNFLG